MSLRWNRQQSENYIIYSLLVGHSEFVITINLKTKNFQLTFLVISLSVEPSEEIFLFSSLDGAKEHALKLMREVDEKRGN